MVKKIFSIILATMLMISVLSVSASTGTALTSGFDRTLSLSEDGAYSYSDDVWNISTSSAWSVSYYSDVVNSDQLDLSIADGIMTAVGKEGNTALVTNNITLGENVDAVYTVFKFMVPAGSVTGQWMINAGGSGTSAASDNVDPGLLGINSDGKIYEIIDPIPQTGKNKENGQAYQRDVWYTAVVKVAQNDMAAYVYGAEGCIAKKELTGLSNRTVGRAAISIRDDVKTTMTIKVKEAQMFTVDVDTNKVEVVSSPSDVTDATNMKPSFTLEFDQPVNTTGITLTPAAGAAVETTVKALTANKLQVTPVDDLTAGTTYTLDWANVTGMAGNTLATGETTSVTYATTNYNPVAVDYTDDFTGVTLSAADGYSSNVWSISAGDSYYFNETALMDPESIDLSVIKDGTNDVLQASYTSSASMASLSMNSTKNGTLGADETVYGMFRFKVPTGQATTGKLLICDKGTPILRIGFDGKIYKYSGSWTETGSDPVAYTIGEWYTVLVAVNSTTAAAYVYDGNNTVVQSHQRTDTHAGWPGLLFTNRHSNATNPVVLIDDSRYMVVNSNNTMELESTSITANATNVGLFDQTVDLKFDMPVAEPASGAITLNGTAVTAAKVDYDTLRVTMPAVLAPSTPYTLNFEGVTGMAGNSLYGTKTLSFTTAEAEDEIVVSGLDKLCNADNDVVPGQKVTVINVGAAKEDVDFIVAFYSAANKLVGAQWITDMDLDAQSKAELQLAADGYVYRGVNGIRVFAFTADSELKPIFNGASYGSLWD